MSANTALTPGSVGFSATHSIAAIREGAPRSSRSPTPGDSPRPTRCPSNASRTAATINVTLGNIVS
ncbi:hypothetical protein [Myxococcus faecalis]|uniref:hypothetical protein n=1 Tax=Myxococcus faecalis TaxID=3115646 RepID=UPI003CF85ADE